MTSLQRLVLPLPKSPLASESLWRLTLLALAAAAFVALRACEYELLMLAAYAAYVAAYVVLPGVVVMYLVQRGRVSLATVLALGVPTGFAVEIFTFLGLAAAGGRELYAWTPAGWLALAGALRWRRGEWPLRGRLTGHHAGIAAGLTAVFLGTVLMAASQMYAESPLADGLPTRAIFHDWVYLVSRAGAIKNIWPLEDPSLAGTPLHYHYFMMVHAAAVSRTTGLELTAVMLRLIYLPLGAVMVAQGYLLGRAVARTPWGGVLAAGLLVAVTELSFARSYGEPTYLGLFVRWLFVSPTFYFGMAYCGALLLAVRWCVRLHRCKLRHWAWLLLLVAAGTGAKGTVVPVLVGALGLWAGWRWWRERRPPWRIAGLVVVFVGTFFLVYLLTMASWRTGKARLTPFHVFEVTSFWREHLGNWTDVLTQALPPGLASPLAQIACAVVVFAGTCGVQLLAVPYLFWRDAERRDAHLVGWLGAFLVVSAAMGLLLELSNYGELYLILMIRLPMAVLTAGFLVAAWRRVVGGWRVPAASAAGARWPGGRPQELGVGGAAPRQPWGFRFAVASGAAVLAVAITLQTSLWWTRNRSGLAEWLNTPPNLQPDPYMAQLREALLWVRRNTEPNAVLVANAFTPENMRKDHWGALDHTLMGVHYYYSALSERRLWFEGPNYVLNGPLLSQRAALASDFFYRGRPLNPRQVANAPVYVLLDRSLQDSAAVAPPLGTRVYLNSRITVYRLGSPTPAGTLDRPVDAGLGAAGHIAPRRFVFGRGLRPCGDECE